ncbi:polyhomeotic-like protein 1 isoform X1 [Fopius arisanus]|uniref:Polyhomeotic-like protein 1 isoform X1 n=1 Tax=Fopius arisanus TaxID=64838 RepID=A0A9R1TSD2_9HYME|nr:PREDICTED: polyhomeotic-like protein 1 isoform X1 [Fopius arisanus]XP_011313954.1 PREDICTED: polyhomeotic-like protein 1 isoform X1 [Fopius arisanus]
MAVATKQIEMSQQQQNVQEQHVQPNQEQQQSQNQQVSQGQIQQQQIQVQSSQQSQQQQPNQNNPQHNVQQVQVQNQVAASMPQQLQGAVAVSMQHQQQQGVGSVSMALAGQQGATTITTMAAHPQAVQVIQQPMQSQAYHLQQLYNTQGTPLLMPGNLALHPAGINPSSIQVIAAGKPFQSAGQLTPHMLTTASNPGQTGGHGGPGGKVQGFPAGYLPVPTSANPGGGQTLVFGQLGVLGSPQPPQGLQQQQQQQPNNNKPDQVQKYTTCATGAPSGQRGGQMQFAPWQFTPQVAWTGIQPPGTTLLAAPNQIFIRSPTQPDMYIQSPQPIQTHNALATQQQIQGVQQIAAAGTKPRVMDIQQQSQQSGKQSGTSQRPLSILPSSLQGVQGANIRPASSVSTQTVHGVQSTVQTQSGKGSGSGGKGRGKPVVRTSPGTNSSQIATKADAANQTKSIVHHATMMLQQQTNATGNNGNNKVLITTNQPVVTSAQPPGSPMTTSDKQNFGQQNKTVMQSQQQHQAQQQQGQQMQPQYQQMFMQQMQHIQHQQLQYQQAQSQNSQQQIQPKPIMGMALPPQQSGVVLGTERPIMPVVSMGGVGVGVATTLQMNQVQQSQMQGVQQLPIPTLNPTIIGNQVVSGGSQIQTLPMIQQSNEPQPQQQENANITPMVISASPDRSQPNDCPQIVQQCSVSNTTTEEDKSVQKKEATVNKERSGTPAQTQEPEGDKVAAKEEIQLSGKNDEKANNPLANLANTVNSITNGVTDEIPAPSATTPVSINSKQAPPKALVKPQVLTHVIEGFVIQEADEPFSEKRLNGTQGTSVLNSKQSSDKDSHNEPPSKKRKKHAGNFSNDVDSNGTSGKCETCGIILDEHNIKFKKDKRFCSSVCAKNKKKEAREREPDKQWTNMEVDKKTDDGLKKAEDSSPAASTPTSEDIPRINPVKWTVNEVCDFIRNLPGCADYAEDFAIQEIDGQALMLLKEDHLMSAMSIKLGPALKIVAKIDSMRIDTNISLSPTSNSS